MKLLVLPGRLPLLLLLLALVTPGQRAMGQSNIVLNGSFEMHGFFAFHWNYAHQFDMENGGLWAMADGTNCAVVIDNLYQDLSTVPDRDYYLQFAFRGPVPQVYFGDQLVETHTNLPPPPSLHHWYYAYGYVKASGPITRLNFVSEVSGTPLDDVFVGWLQEPVTIVAEPQSQIVMEGSSASFLVRAMGGRPLFYQWYFEGDPIGRGTDRVLSLDNVLASQAGNYSVLVSNLYSVTVCSNIMLHVDQMPSAPLIVHQPASQNLPAGYGCAMNVIALGQAPLEYQWRFNGLDRPEATNCSIVFESVGEADAGAYSVLVRNQHGSVASLPATLVVNHELGGGFVSMENSRVNAPVFDTDGTTRLTGSNYICQLYVGASRDMLRPMGRPSGFYPTNFSFQAGFINAVFACQVPDVAADNRAYLQLRVWERLRGSCYEESRARGGKFGSSDIFEVTATYPPRAPNGPMRSFALRTGLPLFTTGKLVAGAKLPDGSRQWTLIGEPGFRYLVEKRQPPHDWEPWLILTNTTGAVTFPDPDDPARPMSFYRSRILD